MNKTLYSNYFLSLSYVIIGILFITTIQNSFFWDTIQLGSKHANFYLDTNFSTLLLPDHLDSGHIPFFGLYIAFIWKVFGNNLIVSHLAMLPFLIGIVWQLSTLISFYFRKEQVGLVVLLTLLDPTLLSQSTLISPDIPLVFFFLFAWNSIIRDNKQFIVLSIFCLFLISMRGMMVAFCLLIIDIINQVNAKDTLKNNFTLLLKRSLIYLPSLVLFIAFNLYHFYLKGWIGFHDESPWAESFESVDFKGFIYNIGILAWRLLDFGRIGIWLVFLFLLLKYKKAIFSNKNSKSLFVICACFLIILPLNMIWSKNLLGHRYLLPIYISFSILTAHFLFSSFVHTNLRKILLSIWFVFILTGNLWVYPDKVSQGWDSTLAHLPYYELRKKTLNYIENQGIDFEKVYSFFPNTATLNEIDLSGDSKQFRNFTPGAEFVIYSNIFNISDNEYETLNKEYILLKEFKKRAIFIKILRRKSE